MKTSYCFNPEEKQLLLDALSALQYQLIMQSKLNTKQGERYLITIRKLMEKVRNGK